MNHEVQFGFFYLVFFFLLFKVVSCFFLSCFGCFMSPTNHKLVSIILMIG